MRQGDDPGAAISLPGAANCRDLGGWPLVHGGTVNRGRVFRSTDLNGLTDPGITVLAGLGIATVYDLRTTAERTAQPDRLPEGTQTIELDVLADEPQSPAAAGADLNGLLADPDRVKALLASSSGQPFLTATYRDLVTLPSATASYHDLFEGIAESGDDPSLFHCTTGKDRTGWAAAALLTFLGVDRDDVFTEYLLTNEEILPFTQPIYDTFEAAGGDPEELRPVLGVDARYLQAAFDEMEASYPSVEDYFASGLRLGDSTLDRLREALTSPSN